MTYLSVGDARAAGAALLREERARAWVQAETVTERLSKSTAKEFDVFLSHSLKDAELVLGVYSILSKQGLRVYVDWIVDSGLDRTAVSASNAEVLRQRMRQCLTLIYMKSEASQDSKWMPWELGYFDGYRAAVAVLPLVSSADGKPTRQEYLDLYPQIDGSAAALWVNKENAPDRLFRRSDGRSYSTLKEWVSDRTTVLR